MDRYEEFFAGINRREISAFKVLYDEYYRALVLYAVNFVGSVHVAEDIVQELFVSIWEKQTVFLSFTSFRTYLYNSVRNASLDYLKHQDVEAKYIESLSESYREMDDSDRLVEEEVRRLLYKEIDRLSPQMRKIFLMYMEGKKNEEIARALDVSTETVKTQRKRALKLLKSRMGSLYFVCIGLHLIP